MTSVVLAVSLTVNFFAILGFLLAAGTAERLRKENADLRQKAQAASAIRDFFKDRPGKDV